MIEEALRRIFELLGYAGTPGLVTIDGPPVSSARSYVWDEVREKFSVDAVYFHGDVPVIYFKGFEAASDTELAELHQRLWNHNRVPLLIAVRPEDIRVYDCFSPPIRTTEGTVAPDGGLLRSIHLAVGVAALQQELSVFRRTEVELRGLQPAGVKTAREYRVDQRLLDNLALVRQSLMNVGLTEHTVNNLVGRSIFVRYLEDRDVLTPEFLEERYRFRSYAELLMGSYDGSYDLFSFLSEKFNGDLFPLDEEETNTVSGEHLHLLGTFLSGTDVDTGQMYFWAYDFKFIPIELISSIYEEFLHESRSSTGAYYTPKEIVDFVLTSTLPNSRTTGIERVLDPACGSGVFLVDAYRRLVAQARRRSDQGQLPFEELSQMLLDSIFGVDISAEAIRVAAFSCYLALLDFVEPKSIWTNVRFPRLLGRNLFTSDFFSTDAAFEAQQYTLIVGNPPWQSRLTAAARDYMGRSGHPIGDQQLAQAFLWRVGEMLAPEGQACLLAPSKGLLFNKSEPNRRFRREFLAAHRVSAIVDFSPFRRVLFQNATGPMAAIFFRPEQAGGSTTEVVRYCTPKPSPLAESLAGVVLSGDEVRAFSRRRVVQHPDIWKIALWGSARDLTFIEDLRERFPTLAKVEEKRGWKAGEGVQKGGGDRNHAPDLGEMRYVPVKAVQPFAITSGPDERIGTDTFHRTRGRRIYAAPHVLVRRGLLSGGVISAAYAPFDAVFTHGLIGIAGPEEHSNELKALSAYLNSSLSRYYQFLTSASWGVERDEIQKDDYLGFPIALPPVEAASFSDLVAFVDRLSQEARSESSQRNQSWSSRLDDLVFACYGVTPSEQRLVLDMQQTIDQFYRGTKSGEFSAPSVSTLTEYAQAFAEVITGALHRDTRRLSTTIYDGSAAYRVVSFHLTETSGAEQRIVIEQGRLDEALAALGRAQPEEFAERFFLRRNLKVFEQDAVHVVKPAERRFWTQSAAYNDADETVGRLIRAAVLV